MAEYKLEDLAREAGMSPRTVRYYVQRGLVPNPPFHAGATTYGDDHLLRLRAIRRLQQDDGLPLEAIKTRLAHASRAELERIASGKGEPDGKNDPPVAMHGLRRPLGPFREHIPFDRPEEKNVRETWDRIELLPGLELHVRNDATVDVRKVALELELQFRKHGA